MTPTEWTYLVFGIVLVGAIIFDLGLLSKKGHSISIKQAFFQTIFWVGLAIGFFVFVWVEDGQQDAIQYLSAYLMEWGLSIDNIFVFILIFSYFQIPEQHANRVLLLGILLAIVLRVIFIAVGLALIEKFYWVLYIFGAFLLFTGVKMFMVKAEEEEFKPEENTVYKLLKKVVRITHENSNGKFTMRINGKKHYTMLFVVLIMLAATDIVFALDSIPAVFAITQDKMMIYTSNIFAVLGLRSLFFLLRGAVEKFKYLKEGIAIVLIFIGLKMLVSYFIEIPVVVSLGAIVVCLGGSVLYSIYKNNQELKQQNKTK